MPQTKIPIATPHFLGGSEFRGPSIRFQLIIPSIKKIIDIGPMLKTYRLYKFSQSLLFWDKSFFGDLSFMNRDELDLLKKG